MKSIYFLLIVLSTVVPIQSSGQCNCDIAVAKDKIIQQSSEQTQLAYLNNISSTEYEELKKDHSLKIGIPVLKTAIDVNASFSEFQKRRNDYFNKIDYKTDSKRETYLMKTYTTPVAFKYWIECIRSCKSNDLAVYPIATTNSTVTFKVENSTTSDLILNGNIIGGKNLDSAFRKTPQLAFPRNTKVGPGNNFIFTVDRGNNCQTIVEVKPKAHAHTQQYVFDWGSEDAYPFAMVYLIKHHAQNPTWKSKDRHVENVQTFNSNPGETHSFDIYATKGNILNYPQIKPDADNGVHKLIETYQNAKTNPPSGFANFEDFCNKVIASGNASMQFYDVSYAGQGTDHIIASFKTRGGGMTLRWVLFSLEYEQAPLPATSDTLMEKMVFSEKAFSFNVKNEDIDDTEINVIFPNTSNNAIKLGSKWDGKIEPLRDPASVGQSKIYNYACLKFGSDPCGTNNKLENKK